MQRIWNVTDWPGKKLGNRNLMVLGKVTPPGRAVQVEEGRLKRAHKVKKLIDKGFLFVGPRPPAAYLAAKKPPRALLEDGVARTHGAMATAPAELMDMVKVEEKFKAELKEAPEPQDYSEE